MKEKSMLFLLTLLLFLVACKNDVPQNMELTPAPTLVPSISLSEEDIVESVKRYYGEEFPVSATEPHVLFYDEKSGMIVFGRGTTFVYITTDGGKTWTEAAIPKAGESLHALVTCAMVVGKTEYCIGYRYFSGDGGTELYYTKDSGESWTRLNPDKEIPEDITSCMRYAEVIAVSYTDGILTTQVSCKTISGKPWSVELELMSEDFGETWKVLETWELFTDATE